MKVAESVQICGTGSGVGKSVIVAGLCRIFLQDGFSVCPFKAQNMSLNSFVTCQGGEIGRAQAMQAQACKIKPSVDMNPILLKPTSQKIAQVILRGRPLGNMGVYQYLRYKKKAFGIVKESFKRLAKEYDLVVIEGAGSPAEVNLKQDDLANLKIAKFADCSAILIGDIERGGVFAHLVGTLELLDKKERERIRGFIINKFRGDRRLLKSGIDFLERKTGIKVLGVIPYFTDIRLPDEDSLDIKLKVKNKKLKIKKNKIKIDVIQLPHISNFTDFDALGQEEDVTLKYINHPEELNSADVIILPGTKNTIEDLLWLNKSGLANKILSTCYSLLATQIIGICGGYQMLGKYILDPKNIESEYKEVEGLGLLPIKTIFKETKVLSQVEAIDLESKCKITGYLIHHGRSINLDNAKPIFKITECRRKRERFDGLKAYDGRVWGTYVHGVFDNDNFRRYFLNKLHIERGLPPLKENLKFNLDKEFDKLAKFIRKNIDMKLVYRILSHEL